MSLIPSALEAVNEAIARLHDQMTEEPGTSESYERMNALQKRREELINLQNEMRSRQEAINAEINNRIATLQRERNERIAGIINHYIELAENEAANQSHPPSGA